MLAHTALVISFVTAVAGCTGLDDAADDTVDDTADGAAALARSGCPAYDGHFQNPFSAQSAHHRPIGAGARYSSGGPNDAMVRALLERNFNSINIGVPWGNSIYKAARTDALVTVHVTAAGGASRQVYIPRAAQHDKITGNDNNVSIYYPWSDSFIHLRGFDWNDGKPVAERVLTFDADGLGHADHPGDPRVGTSASGVANPFGVVRGFELDGTIPIRHVIQLTLVGKGDQGITPQLAGVARWPATSVDGFCKTTAHGDSCTGPIPYGTLFAIPWNVDLDDPALKLSAPGRRFAQALKEYGLRVVDDGPDSIRGDQDIDEHTRALVVADMRRVLFKMLRHVENDERNQATSGGGAPRAPNCGD
jgi:hypothetical protein